MNELMEALANWAKERPDILAIALIGSYARGTATADSDVDILLIVVHPEMYFTCQNWMEYFGEVNSIEDEDWGQVRSRRVFYGSGFEVEFGFAAAAWASIEPVDLGTRRVIANGVVCLHDPTGILQSLIAAVSGDPQSSLREPT